MTILIKGGEVLDGSGAPPKKCDVLIINKQIAAMGDLSSYRADCVFSAAGSYVMPGFIDINSSSDSDLSFFDESAQENFLKQGVTTVVCGAKNKSLLSFLYPEEQFLSNYLFVIKKQFPNAAKPRLSVNFAAFSDYEDIKNHIKIESKDLSSQKINVLSFVLEQYLSKGLSGISLNEKDFSKSEDSQKEIDLISKILLKKNKAAFIPFKSERDNSYISLAESGVKIIIKNFNKLFKSIASFTKFNNLVEKKSFKSELVFTFSPYPYFQLQLSELFSPSIKKNNYASIIKNKTLGFLSKKIKEFDIKKTFVFNVSRKENRFLLGKSIDELARNRGIDPEQVILYLTRVCGPETVLVSQAENQSLMEKALFHPKSVVASSFLSSSLPIASNIHSELSSPFIEYIKLADKTNVRAEFTANKLSNLARLLGFKKRGLIQEGFAADVVVLKDNKPNLVIVNGKIAYENNHISLNRGGEIISV